MPEFVLVAAIARGDRGKRIIHVAAGLVDRFNRGGVRKTLAGKSHGEALRSDHGHEDQQRVEHHRLHPTGRFIHSFPASGHLR